MFLKRVKYNTGFTLTEITIVVIIVGVLASLALPRFTGVFERMKASEGVQLLSALLRAQKAFETENGNYTNNLALLDVEIDTAEYFNAATEAVWDPVDPVANPIATITRIGAYTLGINEEGDITCTEGGAITCARAGF